MAEKCPECERLNTLLNGMYEAHEAYEVGSGKMVDAIDEFLDGQLSLEEMKTEARRLRDWIENEAY